MKQDVMAPKMHSLGEWLWEAYVGDPDSGLLHRAGSSCTVSSGVFYLNWRTALVHGYRLCACCRIERAPSRVSPSGGM